jgi:hypothetical protein
MSLTEAGCASLSRARKFLGVGWTRCLMILKVGAGGAAFGVEFSDSLVVFRGVGGFDYSSVVYIFQSGVAT